MCHVRILIRRWRLLCRRACSLAWQLPLGGRRVAQGGGLQQEFAPVAIMWRTDEGSVGGWPLRRRHRNGSMENGSVKLGTTGCRSRRIAVCRLLWSLSGPAVRDKISRTVGFSPLPAALFVLYRRCSIALQDIMPQCFFQRLSIGPPACLHACITIYS